MKTIILAGGLGTRISEETDSKPKPMVLIDEHPILWHVMNIYATQGFDEFVVAIGYKGEVIHEWVQKLDTKWKIQTLDTGSETQTGGRIKKCMQALPNERVFVTYGDGLANVNLPALLEFHRQQSRKATVTAVRPPARFGVLESVNGQVTNFGEKRQTDAGWINGGFFVLESSVELDIHDADEPFETGALPRLVKQKELSAFHHEGFWQPMDTLRERNLLSDYSKSDATPWLTFKK
jgi:glucose-1-phosphate cytidylyltransferase